MRSYSRSTLAVEPDNAANILDPNRFANKITVIFSIADPYTARSTTAVEWNRAIRSRLNWTQLRIPKCNGKIAVLLNQYEEQAVGVPVLTFLLSIPLQLRAQVR